MNQTLKTNKASRDDLLQQSKIKSSSPSVSHKEEFKIKNKLMTRIIRNNDVERVNKLLKSDEEKLPENL